jgi:Domain of Unknown Function (DUF928)
MVQVEADPQEDREQEVAMVNVQQHPTFWFFIPYQSTQVAEGKFSLQDENNKDIYRTYFKAPQSPGIISVSIPSNLPSLEVNKKYRWYLKLYCNNAKNQVAKETSDFVFGWMQRVALKFELKSQLQTINTPLKQINIYKKNNI